MLFLGQIPTKLLENCSIKDWSMNVGSTCFNLYFVHQHFSPTYWNTLKVWSCSEGKSPSHPTRVFQLAGSVHSFTFGAGPDVPFVEGWVSWRCWLPSVSPNYLASSLEERPGVEQAEPCWTAWLMVGRSLVPLMEESIMDEEVIPSFFWVPCDSFPFIVFLARFMLERLSVNNKISKISEIWFTSLNISKSNLE